jgi:hypothetical protein
LATVIGLSGIRHAGYPNSVLLHVSETLVPNDAKGLTGQVVDLPSDIFIRVVEDGDWRSRIDSRRRWWLNAGEIHGRQIAQQVLDGGDQDGSLGATTGSVEITTDSDNGAASREGSMPGLGSLAAM